MLQSFTAQCGASSGGSNEKATSALIGRRPNQVTDPLKAEHRVVNVERQHRHAMHAVRRRGGDPRGQRARLGDALLQQLTVASLAVKKHRTGVFGFVELAQRRIDADLPKQVGHAKSTRLVRDNGHDTRSERLIFEQVAKQPNRGGRRRHLFAFRLQRKAGVIIQRRHGHDGRFAPARRNIAA